MTKLNFDYRNDPTRPGSFRKLTRTETADVCAKEKELRELEKQIKVLTKKLDDKIASYKKDPFYRNVFSDKAGMPYDVRTYVLTCETNLI